MKIKRLVLMVLLIAAAIAAPLGSPCAAFADGDPTLPCGGC